MENSIEVLLKTKNRATIQPFTLTPRHISGGFAGGSHGKNPPAMWETWVRSLGWEDLLEEGMATHAKTLAWRSPMDRGARQATVHGVAKSRTRLSDFHFHFPLSVSIYVTYCCLVTQSCPIICKTMDCSLPGSSVHGDFTGKNTRMGCHALLQEIFPTQGSNPHLSHLLHWQVGSLPLALPGKHWGGQRVPLKSGTS